MIDRLKIPRLKCIDIESEGYQLMHGTIRCGRNMKCSLCHIDESTNDFKYNMEVLNEFINKFNDRR